MNSAKAANSPTPTRLSGMTFFVKSNLLKFRRAAQDRQKHLRRWPVEDCAAFSVLLAESRTPLWSDGDPAERVLEQGKVQNLRCAIWHLHHIAIPAGETFSFWKQIGRATRRRGYIAGRQIQEGCIMPVVGGGLCQLSNALYDLALQTDCEIIEQHPHSRIVPGSAAAFGRDATVFWNYLDLQFRATQDVLLSVQLTDVALIVRFYGKLPEAQAKSPYSQLLPLLTPTDAGKSCLNCGMETCFRHRPTSTRTGTQNRRTAYLLDEWTPEFALWLQSVRSEADTLAIPLDGKRWQLPRYEWETTGYRNVRSAPLATLQAAFTARHLTEQGAAQRQAQLQRAEALARRLANALTPDCEQVCVAQNLLPFLWRDGHLGGRRFRVLLSRQPITTLQANLDSAAALHPASPTLSDFRAPHWLAETEAEALQAAEQLITPHTHLAALFPHKTQRLPWNLPTVQSVPDRAVSASTIFFPGPTVARKGVYEVREAARRLDLEVVLAGRNLEQEGIWEGVRTRQWNPAGSEAECLAVVQPAFIEDRPRALLRAVASGVPVIATDRCGLTKSANLQTIPCGDAETLVAALRRIGVGKADTK